MDQISKSLWAQYILEVRQGSVQFIEYEWGFISYEFPIWAPDAILALDLFVVPEKRREGYGAQLMEEVMRIGRLSGKKWFLGHVEIGTGVTTESMRAHIGAGMVPIGANNDKILMRRPLYGE
jgi:GNAT superfamily N-acetyltransferase